jgi:hypothetical protein
MKPSRETMPYLNTEGNPIDFNKKRLEFWLETIPPDLRRLEYELYKRNRRLINANVYKLGHKQQHGRFTLMPAFGEELDYNAWEKFQDSFLKGDERKERFSEILESAKRDVPSLVQEHAETIPENKIKLVALGGSSFIGPRREGEFLSDIDLNFLLDQENNKYNFDILPTGKDKEKTPYHLFGTGYGDEARGEKRELHWLLYPHFPIQNSLPDDELRSIIERLVESTEERKDGIIESIEKTDKLLKEKSEDEIIG